MKTVIAHFRTTRVSMGLFALVVVVIVLCVALSQAIKNDGGLHYIAEKRHFLISLIAMGYPLCTLVVLMIFVIIKRLLIQDGMAVWIQDDGLIYLHRTNVFAPRRDILTMTSGKYGRSGRPGIIIEMRDGSRQIIPTGGLVENTEEIIVALKNWILEGKQQLGIG